MTIEELFRGSKALLYHSLTHLHFYLYISCGPASMIKFTYFNQKFTWSITACEMRSTVMYIRNVEKHIQMQETCNGPMLVIEQYVKKHKNSLVTVPLCNLKAATFSRVVEIPTHLELGLMKCRKQKLFSNGWIISSPKLFPTLKYFLFTF
jgi:hypothetical protein